MSNIMSIQPLTMGVDWDEFMFNGSIIYVWYLLMLCFYTPVIHMSEIWLFLIEGEIRGYILAWSFGTEVSSSDGHPEDDTQLRVLKTQPSNYFNLSRETSNLAQMFGSCEKTQKHQNPLKIKHSE